ncbi:MAG TPA: cytochrome c3 family protein [Candidatus Binatia bacterium]|jgi:hypothetical protein
MLRLGRVADHPPGSRPRREPSRRLVALAAGCLVVALAGALAAKPRGENVHRLDGGACRTCHTEDAPALNADPAKAQTALVPDLEGACMRCHGNEGPSHKTNIPPKRPEPAALPLAADGTIGCATCHWMHGEHNEFGSFLRIDNRQGGLCLSCHQLSELQ